MFSYQLCLLGLCVTSNVVKLMFIAYFSLLSLIMMVISVCVNDAVLLLYMLLFKSCFGSSCDSHHLLLLVVISVLQRYRFQYFNRLVY